MMGGGRTMWFLTDPDTGVTALTYMTDFTGLFILSVDEQGI